jgi:hypothetical protein
MKCGLIILDEQMQDRVRVHCCLKNKKEEDNLNGWVVDH